VNTADFDQLSDAEKEHFYWCPKCVTKAPVTPPTQTFLTGALVGIGID
jgi:hypothetical protein